MKKLNVLILIAIGVLCFISSGVQGEQKKSYSFEIGPEVYHFQYVEPKIMKEQGVFYGAKGSFTYNMNIIPNETGLNSMFRFEGRYAQGQVNYEGKTWGGDEIELDNFKDYTFEIRPLIGFDFINNVNIISGVYSGFGYRFLSDDSSEFYGGYLRESKYYYVPVGILVTTELENKVFLQGTFEFDYFIQGVQKSYLSQYELNDVENNQDSGYGFRTSLKIGKQSFYIEPFARLWFIDDSTLETLSWRGHPIGEVYEPKNSTTEFGLSLIWKF